MRCNHSSMGCRYASKGGVRRLRSRHRQHGAALIVAMLIFAICAALIVAMKSEFNRFFQRSANILLAEQAQAYLLGAEQLAVMALIADYDKDKQKGVKRDDLLEDWARPPQPFALDDVGWMEGSLEDLQGRFNINALVNPPNLPKKEKSRFSAEQQQFIRLLQALEEPPVSQQEAITITESISDWLDADDKVSADGAEDDYYFGRTPAHRAANRPMSSASELLAVANMTPEIYQALAPWVTVWPQLPTRINIHTAPAMVLRSLNGDKNLSPLSVEDGEALVAHRKLIGFEDKKAFKAHPVFDQARKDLDPTMALLGVSSDYFLLTARAEVADRNMRLYSVLKRGPRRVDALVRASGSL